MSLLGTQKKEGYYFPPIGLISLRFGQYFYSANYFFVNLL